MNLRALLLILTIVGLVSAWTQVKNYAARETSPQIKALIFSTNNSRLYSAGSNGKIQIFSTQNTDYSLLSQINVGQVVNKLLVNPTDGNIVAATNNGRIFVYSGTNNSLLQNASYPVQGSALDMAWKNAEGSQLYVVGNNTGIPKVYTFNKDLSLNTSDNITLLPDNTAIQQVAVPPNFNNYFFSAAQTNTSFVLQGGSSVFQYQSGSGFTQGPVKLLAFDKNNSNDLIVAQKGTGILETFKVADNSVAQPQNTITLTSGNLISVISGQLSDHVMIGITNGGSNKVLLYDYKNSAINFDLAHDSPIRSISASPNNQMIAVGESTGGLKIWKSTQDTIEQSSRYTIALSVTAGVVFASSVGALAATSVSQGVAGVGAFAGAAGGETAATGKNLL